MSDIQDYRVLVQYDWDYGWIVETLNPETQEWEIEDYAQVLSRPLEERPSKQDCIVDAKNLAKKIGSGYKVFNKSGSETKTKHLADEIPKEVVDFFIKMKKQFNITYAEYIKESLDQDNPITKRKTADQIALKELLLVFHKATGSACAAGICSCGYAGLTSPCRAYQELEIKSQELDDLHNQFYLYRDEIRKLKSEIEKLKKSK